MSKSFIDLTNNKETTNEVVLTIPTLTHTFDNFSFGGGMVEDAAFANGCIIAVSVVQKDFKIWQKIGVGTVVEPHVKVDDSSSFGTHGYIGAGTVISSQVTVGNDCFIGAIVSIEVNTTIGDDVAIGKGVVIGRSCKIGKGVTIGDYVQLYDGAIIEDNATIFEYSFVKTFPLFEKEEIIEQTCVLIRCQRDGKTQWSCKGRFQGLSPEATVANYPEFKEIIEAN